MKDALSKEPYGILSASSTEEALPIVDRQNLDVVISDEKMPVMSGSEFLAVVRRKHPDAIRMILTGHASLDSAIRAINEGEVYRFFTKPCNVFDLAMTIRQAIKLNDIMKESRRLLKIVKRQLVLIESLVRQYSDITKIKRDTEGDINTDDEIDRGECDALIEQIDTLVIRLEAFFWKRDNSLPCK